MTAHAMDLCPPQCAKSVDDGRREGRSPKGRPSAFTNDPGGEGDSLLLMCEPIKIARERKIGGHCGDGFVAIAEVFFLRG